VDLFGKCDVLGMSQALRLGSIVMYLGDLMKMNVLIAAVILSWASLLDLAAIESARLSIRVVDAKDTPIPARAWVDVNNERYFEPIYTDTVTVYAKDRSFSCDGVFSMARPAGRTVMHVEKG
jgi:hypothetical protein